MKTSNFKTASIIFTLLITLVGHTQSNSKENLVETLVNKSEKELLRINSGLMINLQHYNAFLTAERLLTYNPESPNYNYRLGFAILNNSGDFERAIPHLEIAISNIKENFDMLSINEDGAPIEASFFMGKAYHLSGQIDKAIKYYMQFTFSSDKYNPYREEVEINIQQCTVAKNLMDNPTHHVVKNLGASINTDASEYSPLISSDGTRLYFTSKRRPNPLSNQNIKKPGPDLYLEDIFVSKKNEDKGWDTPEVLSFCNPDLNETPLAISPDEETFYAYSNKTGDGDIYYSKRDNDSYQELTILEHKGVNTKAWETHLTVSPDGKRKYFVSDRKGGYGGRDIYYIEKTGDRWSKPKNLGPTINTPYDEESPFITKDNKTMYFASNGPNSMGGFDIFKSELDDNDQWTTPENLGYPLNTSSNEIYYSTTSDESIGYLASLRKDGAGKSDIYEVKIEDTPETSKETIASYFPLEMKHLFRYENHTLDTSQDAFKNFMDSLMVQIKRGRDSIEIEINTSNSKAPMINYDKGFNLAMKRAEITKELLNNYFLEKELEDKIVISINRVAIAGPEFDEHSFTTDKYMPHQFVELKLKGNYPSNTAEVQFISADEKDADQEENFTASALINESEKSSELIAKKEENQKEFKYQVIVGAFRGIDYAERLLNKITKNGYDGKILTKRSGLHLVSAGNGNNKEEINKLLKRVRNEVIQTAWIFDAKQ